MKFDKIHSAWDRTLISCLAVSDYTFAIRLQHPAGTSSDSTILNKDSDMILQWWSMRKY